MGRNQILIIGAVIVLLAVGGIYFLRSNSAENAVTEMNDTTSQQSSAPSDMDQSSSSSSGEAESGVKEFTVNGSAFKFEPSTLTVSRGDKVRINFKNLGGTHDFVIDELGVKTKTINSGQSEMVEFTADKSGTFEYYCAVGNHRQMGMKGTLTVN